MTKHRISKETGEKKEKGKEEYSDKDSLFAGTLYLTQPFEIHV